MNEAGVAHVNRCDAKPQDLCQPTAVSLVLPPGGADKVAKLVPRESCRVAVDGELLERLEIPTTRQTWPSGLKVASEYLWRWQMRHSAPHHH